MGYTTKRILFRLTEKQMFLFLLKQAVEAKTNDDEPFTILMNNHSVKASDSKTIIDVSFSATVGKDGESYDTENGSLISVDHGCYFLGSVDLKIFGDTVSE